MVLKHVTYVKAKNLTPEQKQELGVDETLKEETIAIETHNPNHDVKTKVLRRGMVNYILNGV